MIQEIMLRTPEVVENERVEALKKINEVRENVNVLLVEKFNIKKRLVELDESIRQGKHLIAVKKTEGEILTAEFWKSK